MLIKHIKNNDKVLVQVDSDCDGYTSAAVLINYLYKHFPYWTENNIIYTFHSNKAHGINLDLVPKEVKLVIAPDSSSNDYEIHEILYQQGIDVLVIDHHNAEKISEYACVINNQLCDYPTKSLSGVGMVYKFCSYIDNLLKVDTANDLIDLVSLGLISDMMDMRDFETRHLITLGLKNIQNPFFATMVNHNVFQLTEQPTPIGIAFYVAPYINAVTRSGTEDEKRLLFESMLTFKAYNQILSTKRGCRGQLETIVEQAVRNCTNIKNRQTKSLKASLEIVEKLIEEENLLKNKILFVRLRTPIDKNLTGLIGNQLMSKYQRPVLILNKTINEQNEIWWEGSGRGYDKSSFKNFQQFLKDCEYTEYAEGHASAFGFGIKDINCEKFLEYSNNKLKDYDFTPCYNVDFIFNPNKLQGYEIMDIASLKDYWGQGIPEPYVAIEKIKVNSSNIQLLKGTTLKITLLNNISLIKFKSNEEEYENLYSQNGYIEITVIGFCNINNFNGNSYPQILIEDYEITDKKDYYF